MTEYLTLKLLCFLQGLDRLAEYDYVAIFDADFKPDADFLVCAILLCFDRPNP